MKLLLENWREYVAEKDSELSETIEKLLRMDFNQAISLINALKTSEDDNYLEARYRVALEREYKDSKKERQYWIKKLDIFAQIPDTRGTTAISRRLLRNRGTHPLSDAEKDWNSYYDAEEKHQRIKEKFFDMDIYFTKKDKL